MGWECARLSFIIEQVMRRNRFNNDSTLHTREPMGIWRAKYRKSSTTTSSVPMGKSSKTHGCVADRTANTPGSDNDAVSTVDSHDQRTSH